MDIVISEPSTPSNPYLDRITLVQGNVVDQAVDAIVTLIPQNLEYRGDVNAALLEAAGEDLDSFVIENIYRPRPGDVYAVPGFNVASEHIFFCVVPHWRADFERQDKYLLNSVRKALELAKRMSLKSVAIPPLASGRRGFPKPRAARLIVQAIEDRLDEKLDEVRLICLADTTVQIFQERLGAIGWKQKQP